MAGAIALIAALLLALPAAGWLDGLSLDALFWLREQVAPARHDGAPTAVIAIDEETYRREPFKDVPQAMWTPQLARVLNATYDAGAKVVGFDVIYSTSIEGYIRGYERDWLLALRRGAREGRLVLGKVQHQEKPILPHVGALRIVGEENVHSLNADSDPDGIIRRMPLLLARADGSRETSFALELAQRAAGVKAELIPSGVQFGPYLVPSSRDGSMGLRFRGGAVDVPTYSLADLNACVEAGEGDFLRRAFAGKIVLFGVVLDVEDRKLTSKRLITRGPGADTPRCKLPVMVGVGEGSAGQRDTIPGVYLHATAIDNLLQGNALVIASTGVRTALTVALALAAAGIALLLSPAVATLAVAGLALAWAAASTAAFTQSHVLPLLAPLIAAAVSFGLQWAYRFAIADREKRKLRHAFQHYLAPAVVKQLVEGSQRLELGGETRELTVWFSDVQSFTKIAERLADPHALVEFMNQYLSEMTDIVEAHGGFVDKYIGDAIVAVFGAPLADPDHARKAVASVLACQARLSEIQASFGLPPDLPVRARIGVNTGEMLVGNIGSRRRFNYTVMGDAVNLASRIEGANKAYGTYVLVSDSTRAACGQAFAFREVDSVRVVGRAATLTLFEPMTWEQAERRAQRDAAYMLALMQYREARFGSAVEHFARLAEADAPAGYMMLRCRALMMAPPPPDWGGVFDLESK